MFTCIYSGKTCETSSGEHILQNALGTRWTSESIVCDELQKEFGETIDVEIAAAMQPFRSLFNVTTGRGKPASALRNLESSSGYKAALEPGGILGIEAPRVKIETATDGTRTLSVASRPGDIDWAIHLVAQQAPGINKARLKTALQKAKASNTGTPNGETVKVSFRGGGRSYERAVLKAAFNLAGAGNLPVLNPAFDPLRQFVRDGIGLPESFIRYATAHSFQPETKLGPIDHFILLASRGKEVVGLIQLFGAIQHSVCLSQKYDGPEFQLGYAVNPLRHPIPAESRIPKFKGSEMPEFQIQPPKPGPRVWEWQSAGITRVMNAHQEIISTAQIHKIVDEVRGPVEALWTEDKLKKLKERLESELGVCPSR